MKSDSATPQPTPLEPRTFFTGTWRGEGDFIPSRPLSLFIPREHFRYQGQPIFQVVK